MSGRDFLPLARRLLLGTTEAEWRTAVSRAYYAAFHVARDLLQDCGFSVPRTEQAHRYLAHRLSNAGHAQVRQAGSELDMLRDQRNQADYEVRRIARQGVASARVKLAE